MQSFFNYEYYLFDLWGVVHDGSSPYPFIKDVLAKLKSLDKKIGFISNAPRMALIAKQTLINIGIDDNFIDAIVTSGECFYKNTQNIINKGDKIFYIGPKRDVNILDLLNVSIETKDPSLCTYGIITGFGDGVENDDKLRQILQKCKDFNLKLFCLNPDLIVVKQDGSVFECAGIIANIYEQIGGIVEYFGKPYSKIYEQIFEELAIPNNQKHDVIAIGDSISTDIKGANNFGISSALCTYGIHSSDIKKAGSVDLFLSSKQYKPNFVINSMKDLVF